MMDADDVIIGIGDRMSDAPMPDRDPALQAALQSASIEASYTLATLDGCRNDEETNDLPPCGECRQAALAVMYEQGPYLFQGGYHAAFRSLGAVTPEARAALRELVRASVVHAKSYDKYMAAEAAGWSAEGCDAVWEATAKAAEVRDDAVDAFARLATPPEEGR